MENLNLVKRSESIAELASSLAKVNKTLQNIQKDIEGAKGKSDKKARYKYFDIADLLDHVRKPLAEVGISVLQFNINGSNSKEVGCITMLLHESGQYIESPPTYTEVDNPVNSYGNKNMNDIQAYGSALSYVRRYSLSSVLGLAGTNEDNDGATIGADENDNNYNNNNNYNKNNLYKTNNYQKQNNNYNNNNYQNKANTQQPQNNQNANAYIQQQQNLHQYKQQNDLKTQSQQPQNNQNVNNQNYQNTNAPTEKQVKYLKDLLEKKGVMNGELYGNFCMNVIGNVKQIEQLSKAEVQTMISAIPTYNQTSQVQ